MRHRPLGWTNTSEYIFQLLESSIYYKLILIFEHPWDDRISVNRYENYELCIHCIYNQSQCHNST